MWTNLHMVLVCGWLELLLLRRSPGGRAHSRDSRSAARALLVGVGVELPQPLRHRHAALCACAPPRSRRLGDGRRQRCRQAGRRPYRRLYGRL